MVSGSDRHASRWHRGFRIPGADELTLDHAYRAMIWLGEEVADGRTATDAIEEDLYRHRQELFGEVSIAFFDTTSLYFEGAGGQTLGQFGHSKDYRPHLKQVVLGMVLDGDDRPFASFLWPGNTADVTQSPFADERLAARLDLLRRRRDRLAPRETNALVFFATCAGPQSPLRSGAQTIDRCRVCQAACCSGTLISDSAGIPRPLYSCQTIRKVNGRLRLSTS